MTKNSSSSTNSSTPSIHPQYEYSNSDQGLILSLFYVGYMCFHLPGAILCTLFGFRRLLMGCIMGVTIMTFLVPVCATWGLWFLLGNRIITGIASSALYPLTHDILAIWIPVDKLTRLGAITLSGSNFGLIFTYIVGGPVSESMNPVLGWPGFLYINASLGFIALILVYFFVYDSPETHPRISEAEKKAIAENRHPHPKIRFSDIPFKKILTSVPFYASCFMHAANNFAVYSLTSLNVKYFYSHHKVTVTTAGFITSLLFLIMTISQYIISYFVNRAINLNPNNKTIIKKKCNSIGVGLCSLCLLLATEIDGGVMYSAVFMCFAAIFLAFPVVGYFTGMIDMCHEFAAIVMGIANMCGSLSGVLCSIFAGKLLDLMHNEKPKAWKVVFGVIASFNVIGGFIWLKWGDCRDQKWGLYESSATKNLLNSEHHHSSFGEKEV